MDLSGKNVVFVAGLGGIGFEACKILMTKNLAYLVVLDVIENPKAIQTLEAINPQTKVIYMKFDVTDKTCIKNTFNQIVSVMKFIDVLINGAGVILDRNIELAVNINLIGLINTTMEALPYMDKMQKGRGGVLMNIASVVGLEPSPAVAIYSATKFGVVGFTRSLSDPYYYNRTGVAVTSICPGVTESPMSKNPKISDTFDYSKPLTEKFFSAPSQPASVCAEHLVKIIEMAENGSMWISSLGEMTKVEHKVHWTP
ncbi:alcohol dehydrogenase-like [Lucilia sericata]|uniref:alcohol dehydrogenase-like n=1 Tax=Lucilia sericata TaxID=13632 RepID=UPI0018A7FD9B|nr:alcohol dehydrogenase-like [Lucilia sericata]